MAREPEVTASRSRKSVGTEDWVLDKALAVEWFFL